MSSATKARTGQKPTATFVNDSSTQTAVFRDLTSVLPNSNNIRWQATPMRMKSRGNKSAREGDKEEVNKAEIWNEGYGNAPDRKTEKRRVNVDSQRNAKGKKPRFNKENETPTIRHQKGLEGVDEHYRGLEARVINTNICPANNAGLSAPGALPPPRRVAQLQLPDLPPRKVKQEENSFRKALRTQVARAVDDVMKEVLGDEKDEDDDAA